MMNNQKTSAPTDKFQETLQMITEGGSPIHDAASELHEMVFLCQLIAGARFGEECAQDPDTVIRLVGFLMDVSAGDEVEAGEDKADPFLGPADFHPIESTEDTRIRHAVSQQHTPPQSPDDMVEPVEAKGFLSEATEAHIAGAPLDLHEAGGMPEPETAPVEEGAALA